MDEDTVIENFLISVGISPSKNGFGISKAAIKHLMHDPGAQLYHGLYPWLAKQFGVSANTANRHIGEAITNAYDRDPERASEALGLVPALKRGKLTNAEFLRTAVVKVQQLLREERR